MIPLSIKEALELIAILLANIRDLNKELARAESNRIDVFKMGCKEHALGLVEGNPPRHCAVCGKPFVGIGERGPTYKELKEMYEAAMRGKEDLSRAADEHAEDSRKWRETSDQMAAAMKMYKDEANHHAMFLRGLARDLKGDIAASGGLTAPQCETLAERLNKEANYDGAS